MIEQDTIRLLRECDAGIKMGVSSIDEVLDRVKEQKMKDALRSCREKHMKLEKEVHRALERFGDTGKEPNPIAKGMSWIKTAVKLEWEESDETIAELMVDGCNMGIKSLCKYLNQYEAADEDAKAIAGRLIALEEELGRSLRRDL